MVRRAIVTAVLPMWTIYAHPLDYPEGYVVREWNVVDGAAVAGPASRALTLGGARGLVPVGLYCLPRSPGDDPAVLETWL